MGDTPVGFPTQRRNYDKKFVSAVEGLRSEGPSGSNAVPVEFPEVSDFPRPGLEVPSEMTLNLMDKSCADQEAKFVSHALNLEAEEGTDFGTIHAVGIDVTFTLC